MNIEIKKLTPDLLEDYLYFFDDVACSDHEEWSQCYCRHFHWSNEMQEENVRLWHSGVKRYGRDIATELIQNGILQGYLAYLDGQVVGWCNANERSNYCVLTERRELFDSVTQGKQVKSIVCFTVAPAMRRQGIATHLLTRVCEDAVREGYDVLEAYPVRGDGDCFSHHHGPLALFEKMGFAVEKVFEHDCLVRRVSLSER